MARMDEGKETTLGDRGLNALQDFRGRAGSQPAQRLKGVPTRAGRYSDTVRVQELSFSQGSVPFRLGRMGPIVN
jgi:hypothetical protein